MDNVLTSMITGKSITASQKKVAAELIAMINRYRVEVVAMVRESIRAENTHCNITGNPCGTDTRPQGGTCKCINCVRYYEI